MLEIALAIVLQASLVNSRPQTDDFHQVVHQRHRLPRSVSVRECCPAGPCAQQDDMWTNVGRGFDEVIPIHDHSPLSIPSPQRSKTRAGRFRTSHQASAQLACHDSEVACLAASVPRLSSHTLGGLSPPIHRTLPSTREIAMTTLQQPEPGLSSSAA